MRFFFAICRAIQRSNCFHRNGHEANCYANNNGFMLIFASFQLILSQIPNFHKLGWLSIVAAVMSFAYSTIGLGLSLAKVAEGNDNFTTTLTGVTVGEDVTGNEKIWKTFQSLGDIAFAYAFSTVLVEIQVNSTLSEHSFLFTNKIFNHLLILISSFYRTR